MDILKYSCRRLSRSGRVVRGRNRHRLFMISPNAGTSSFAGKDCTKLALQVIPVRRYWTIALVVGVFKNIADEFYRRYAVPYEDEKIAEHGDVYEA